MQSGQGHKGAGGAEKLEDRGPAPGVCRDPDDDYLLGCAVAGAADYLVTGDEDLLAVGRYQGLAIVTAREFLAILSR